MTTTVLAPYLKQRFFDNNGNPAVNGTITTYAAGTTTPIATYKDSVGTVNANPIVLNARGECDIWVLPNVSYKFVGADVAGNVFLTEDNVTNSQLITLYGGVDTGSTNAYVLNFTANFTAYTDGIVLYWIPSHSNTGASTINVNGLGAINLLNADGSALVAGEIIANQPATILIKGGAAIITTPATTVYGTFTCGWAGFSVAPGLTTITYRKNGTKVTLLFPSTTGTSNSTSFTMTGLPAFLTPSFVSSLAAPMIGFEDNGAAVAGGMAQVLSASNSISFFKDATQPNWTAAGVKGFEFQTLLDYTI